MDYYLLYKRVYMFKARVSIPTHRYLRISATDDGVSWSADSALMSTHEPQILLIFPVTRAPRHSLCWQKAKCISFTYRYTAHRICRFWGGVHIIVALLQVVLLAFATDIICFIKTFKSKHGNSTKLLNTSF